MDERLKRRVVGAAVLVVAVVVFVPMLLDQGKEAPEQPRGSTPLASSHAYFIVRPTTQITGHC